MQRTRRTRNTKPANLILTADWHLREDTPVCRTDDFQQAQWQKVKFVKTLQEEHGCPVLHAGDLFNHWKPSPWLIAKTLIELPKDFHTVYGNHDLPQHNLNLASKSGVYTVAVGRPGSLLHKCHYGDDPNKDAQDIKVHGRRVLVWHVMTYAGKEPYPGVQEDPATRLLAKYRQYDLIVTGDNHEAFTVKLRDRLLVNPGSLTRQEAGQVDFRPRVYLYWADTNAVKPVYLPIDKSVISRAHIERTARRDERIEAFVSRLSDDYEVELSFEKNLQQFARTNQVRQSVMDIIYKSIET